MAEKLNSLILADIDDMTKSNNDKIIYHARKEIFMKKTQQAIDCNKTTSKRQSIIGTFEITFKNAEFRKAGLYCKQGTMPNETLKFFKETVAEWLQKKIF